MLDKKKGEPYMPSTTPWAVETEKLNTAAGTIREKTSKYHDDYEKLYTELQSLRSAQWQGIASDTFNSKLDTYKGTFQEVETVLRKFADALENIATNYVKTEDAVKDAASAL